MAELNGTSVNGHNGTAAEGLIATRALREFFPSAKRDIEISFPQGTFFSDGWTGIFGRGIENKLSRVPDITNHTVLEVGTGAGTGLFGILLNPNAPKRYIGSDYSDVAVAAAKEIAQRHGFGDTHIRQSDLLKSFTNNELADVHHIVACIPQVPADAAHRNLRAADNSSHYYIPDGSSWDHFGLGLNARLLQEASERAPHATVTLNLAGRAGEKTLLGLFQTHGYQPQIQHVAVVSQHDGTSLASLAKLEKQDKHPFEFFADRDCKQPITAALAEKLRVADLKSRENGGAKLPTAYHKVYVVTGTLAGGPV